MHAVRIQDARIEESAPASWEIQAGGLLLGLRYDEALGLALERWDNLTGERPVRYYREPTSLLPFAPHGAWRLGSKVIEQVNYGGRPAVGLRVQVSTLNLRLTWYAVAFPGCPVIRFWSDAENTSFARDEELLIQPFTCALYQDDYRDTYICRWFVGGNSHYDQGLMHSEPLGGRSQKLQLHSESTYHYVPLVLLQRANLPRDGLMAALDYCGTWDLECSYDTRRVNLAYTLDGGRRITIRPGENLALPVITLAAYSGEQDNLMTALYDWQYTYMWDYTNADYHARTRGIGNWVYSARNLHEQFTWRLANFNLRGAQEAQAQGYEMFWDDAGWSAYPGWPPDDYASVFQNTYDGPDFYLTQRFRKKCGIGWVLWFAGNPSNGLLASKEAAWGSYEWRTDAFSVRDVRDEAAVKRGIRTYLEGSRGRSFHTCSGGSSYAHTFDMQRYANYNYLADGGVGPYLNYYFSYFETPDRWGDILLYLGDRMFRRDGSTTSPLDTYDQLNQAPRYAHELARARLSMVPMTGPGGDMVSAEDRDTIRRDLEIYHYLLRRGVAGRWSYLYHPAVCGDEVHFYAQRTSRDGKRACIILGHRPEGAVTVYPKGLNADQEYEVTFQVSDVVSRRTGSDLSHNGITLSGCAAGELIYLNLPDHPGAGLSGEAPSAPGRALSRREQNVGITGIGIYWSAAQPSEYISYYEVARDNVVIARVAVGKYYFDTDGWPQGGSYSIRAVDSAGRSSAWQLATRTADEPLQVSALGGFGSPKGSSGWSAEVSRDLAAFTPMEWVPPANNSAADFGGTPNQPGGIEGYWESQGARVGRGWQQAAAGVYGSLTYTVRQSGRVRVTGHVLREWYHRTSGEAVQAVIRHNGRQVWPQDGWCVLERGDARGAEHDIMLQVEQGDTLRFITGLASAAATPASPWEEGAALVGWIPCITYEQAEAGTADERDDNLRLACGSERAVTDACGLIWQADACFTEGSAARTTPTLTELGALFASARTGREVHYRIPLAPGVYALRLALAEPEATYGGERSFNVSINGEVVTRELDITVECRGKRCAYERIYRYLVPDSAGCLDVRVVASKGEAIIQGIEIAPEAHDHLLVNCGAQEPYIDWSGQRWEADYACDGGTSISSTLEPSQATPTLYDTALYQTARCGHELTYRLQVRPGMYDIQLKFAELWGAAPGSRVCDIMINGRLARAGWDIAQAAGRERMACGVRLEGISPVEGAITIALKAKGSEPAVIQAIEVE